MIFQFFAILGVFELQLLFAKVEMEEEDSLYGTNVRSKWGQSGTEPAIGAQIAAKKLKMNQLRQFFFIDCKLASEVKIHLHSVCACVYVHAVLWTHLSITVSEACQKEGGDSSQGF